MPNTRHTIPPDSLLYASPAHYVDTYRGALRADTTQPSGQDLLRAFFGDGPRWVEHLFALRNRIVRAFGLKTGDHKSNAAAGMATRHFAIGDRIGLFEVFAVEAHEALIGANDKHLDFRVSLLAGSGKLHITTTVHFHNRWGRLYFLPVKPFHGQVVPAILRKMVAQLP